jgi:predicted fused transcriptional regulator/phosphomethylpyrimidine kinase/predicted transcriptional regulator
LHILSASLNKEAVLGENMLGTIGNKWLDRLHQQLAKELRANGWSQMEIAKATGSTQSTVSRQITKVAQELGATADEVTIDGWAQELAHSMTQMGKESEVIRQRLIIEFQFTGNQNIRYDKTLTGMNLDADQASGAILRRLEWSAGRLDLKRLSSYMPAVGMNMAACTNQATTVEEVAAYPGRMTVVEGVLRRHETPVFGASNHLANLLMRVRETDSSKTAILNLRPPMVDGMVDQGDLDYISDELGFELGFAPKGELQQQHGTLDILIDEGAFGWEPSLYILATTTTELVERCHVIIDAMNTE